MKTLFGYFSRNKRNILKNLIFFIDLIFSVLSLIKLLIICNNNSKLSSVNNSLCIKNISDIGKKLFKLQTKSNFF